jgi:hypothetical protein
VGNTCHLPGNTHDLLGSTPDVSGNTHDLPGNECDVAGNTHDLPVSARDVPENARDVLENARDVLGNTQLFSKNTLPKIFRILKPLLTTIYHLTIISAIRTQNLKFALFKNTRYIYIQIQIKYFLVF